jgi:hypothetical protein
MLALLVADLIPLVGTAGQPRSRPCTVMTAAPLLQATVSETRMDAHRHAIQGLSSPIREVPRRAIAKAHSANAPALRASWVSTTGATRDSTPGPTRRSADGPPPPGTIGPSDQAWGVAKWQ